MTGTASPTVWRRRVAMEMKRLRLAAGLSQADVARVLGCRVPKISLIENGQRNMKLGDLEKLLALYEVDGDARSYYMTAAERGQGKGWWESYDAHAMPRWFQFYVGLEQGADRLRAYSSSIFHGLLQTPEYATAVLGNSTTVLSPEVLRRRVALRTRRQIALTREVDPLDICEVLDESALRRILGGREVMRHQLEHVAALAERYPNVTVRVIPFDRGAIWHSFSIFSFSWPDDPGVVYVEYQGGGLYMESLAEVHDHSSAFQRLQALALSPEESLDLLWRVAAQYRSSTA